MSTDEETIHNLSANSSDRHWLKRHQEVSCIETPVSLDCLKMRERVTRNIALSPSPDNDHPIFKFEGAEHFKIVDLHILTKTSTNSDGKKIKLLVVIQYDLLYSDGKYELVQPDNACFELTIDKIKCPNCIVKRFQKNCFGTCSSVSCKESLAVKALAQAFGDMICSYTGALIVDLGVFFIIDSIYIMQLIVPSVLDCDQCQKQKEESVLRTDEKSRFYEL